MVAQNPHFAAFQSSQLGGPTKGLSGLHLDILNGNDETLEPADFLPCEWAGTQSRRAAG